MREDSIAKLEALCATGKPQTVQVNRYEDSYAVVIGCDGPYSFRLRSREMNLAKQYDDAGALLDGLHDAFTVMGEPQPEAEVRTSILYMVPSE